MISSQWAIVFGDSKSIFSVSTRRSPFCFFSPWQLVQCSVKNGFTTLSKSRESAACNEATASNAGMISGMGRRRGMGKVGE